FDLGALNSDGAVTGIAVGSSGNVYISGQTSNAALDGSIVNAHSGGTDGFVSQIIDAGASASVGFTTYVGSTSTDTVGGIAVKASAGADEIYLTGATQGAVDGGADATVQDAFVMKLDNTGTQVWASQDHGAVSQSGNSIAYNASASSVISRLGLTTGDMPADPGTEVLSLTTARPGQYFSIQVDGGATKRIEIDADDTLGLLAIKINNAMGQYGSSTVQRGTTDSALKIEAKNGAVVQIMAGPDGMDALASLGLTEGTLYAKPEGLNVEETLEAKEKIFELGMTSDMSLLTTTKAKDVNVLLNNAIREVRKMFRYIAVGPETEDPLAALNNLKPADSERLAQMQGALAAISGVASSMNLTNQMRQAGEGGGGVKNIYNIIS
nr:hypothetical protein [Alphaproteobacteria bacterium]